MAAEVAAVMNLRVRVPVFRSSGNRFTYAPAFTATCTTARKRNTAFNLNIISTEIWFAKHKVVVCKARLAGICSQPADNRITICLYLLYTGPASRSKSIQA